MGVASVHVGVRKVPLAQRMDSLAPEQSPLSERSGISNLERELAELQKGDVDPDGPKPGQRLEDYYNSANFHKQWLRLGRMSSGSNAPNYPDLAKLFQGSRQDKAKALKMYLDAGENMEAAQASFKIQKTHVERQRRNRQLMTLKQMTDAGFSECLPYLFLFLEHEPVTFLTDWVSIFTAQGQDQGLHRSRSYPRP